MVKVILWRYIGLLAPLICVSGMKAQGVEQGLLPKIIISKGLDKGWKVISNTQLRLISSEEGSHDSPALSYSLLDQTTFVSYRIGVHRSAQVGYLFRFVDGEKRPIQRAIQRFSHTTVLRSSRLGQRLGTDQTFFPSADIEYRIRYRISWEKPLNGDKVDVHELFLRSSIEGFAKNRSHVTKAELRGSAFLGREFSKKTLLEFGPDFRWDEPGKQGTAILWWTINLYVSL